MREEGTGIAMPARDAIERAWLTLGDGRRISYGLGTALLRSDGDLAVLERAYAGGFRLFDTSLYYGDSELLLGRFLRSVPRESIFLATKTQIVRTRFEESGRPEVASFLRSCLDQSLQRLGVDYVDLYQFHELQAAGNLEIAAEEGRKLQREGRIRYLGATGRDLEVLGRVVRSACFDTVLTYADYTPLTRTARTVLRDGAAAGVAMINATPLAGGLLGGDDPRTLEWPEEGRADVEKAGRLYDLCSRLGVSPRTLALQLPMMNSDIAVTLTGPLTVEHLDHTLESLREPVDAMTWRAWDGWRKSDGVAEVL